MRPSWLLIGALAIAFACAPPGSRAPGQGTPRTTPAVATPTPVAEVTKPPFSQPPLDAPTMVSWSIDRSGDPARPYTFELHYDGAAMGFWVVDTNGARVLQLPIAGSGIFGPETCMAAVNNGTKLVATWRAIDDATYRDLVARAATLRVEVETIGHGTITSPLIDTGCRR